MSESRISDQEKAAKANETLRNWIEKTKLEKVPKNQFGRANRGKILTELGIRGSKDQQGIKDAFSELDESLIGIPATKNSTNNDDEVKSLKRRINELEKKLTLITIELNQFKKHDKLIEHLINTGAIIR
ncbi:MAG: hypothetical protein OQK75_04430 [Gammaproteobacteria bacterium]|nr:hypothetical protein [Gammaproteobacteria bacterium]MCW8986898.1 hypothetical protein [Gammaproteobacteria bacterium]MCW9030573.1 hypothetical protein [Gammaproteobacteria bacterium]